MNKIVFADLFCVDCKGYKIQKLSGKNIYDGTLRYICTECGCENNINDESIIDKQIKNSFNL